jgi:hypothetical protein
MYSVGMDRIGGFSPNATIPSTVGKYLYSRKEYQRTRNEDTRTKKKKRVESPRRK